jgi:hypothetical protein
MRKRAFIALLATLATLATASVAGAITVSATVNAGVTLSANSVGNPSFALTLNGVDQTATYVLGVTVLDARGIAAGGANGGWNLTVTSTQFNDGAGGHTFPATASTMTAMATPCGASSTCTQPTNNIVNTSLSIPAATVAPTAVKYENAASGSGLGTIVVNPTITVAVPANVYAGTYTSTVTVAIVQGP